MGAECGNEKSRGVPWLEFATPLRRGDAIPRSVLRAVVEAGGQHRVLSDIPADKQKGKLADLRWRVVQLRHELFASSEAEWIVSLDSDVVTTGRCVRSAIAFLQRHKEYGAVAITYQGHLPLPDESSGHAITVKQRGKRCEPKTYHLKGPHYPAGLVVGRGDVFRSINQLHTYEKLPKALCECYAISESVLELGWKMCYLEGYVAADLKLRDRLGYISTPYRVVAVLRWYPLETKPELAARKWLRVRPGSVIRADWYVRGVGVVELPDGRLRWVAARRSVPMPMHDAVGDRARWTDDGTLLPMRHGGR